VIAATNANIQQMVTQGVFRQDLLYRLNTVEIVLPPLRERTADILIMAEHFLSKFCDKYQKSALTLTPQAKSLIQQYSWPGNIRELSHMMERAVVLSSGTEVNEQHLSINTPTESSAHDNGHNITVELSDSLADIEKRVIADRIAHYKGNMIDVAKSLGLSRSAFYRRIDKYEL